MVWSLIKLKEKGLLKSNVLTFNSQNSKIFIHSELYPQCCNPNHVHKLISLFGNHRQMDLP
jgi:hypothetical protein